MTFLFHLQMQKKYSRITYLCLKKLNVFKSPNKTNMTEKNTICCDYSAEIDLCCHPSIHIPKLLDLDLILNVLKLMLLILKLILHQHSI